MARKPLILAVETSGRTGSVAIATGDKLLAETDFTGPMKHSAELFPAVARLLDRFSRKPEEIDHIYISVGPGSFTGLRIAVSLAKIMHLANAAKIVPVDTLDVIAANATYYINEENKGVNKIAAVLDAKRSQFFIAVYQPNTSHGTWQKVLPDSLMTAPLFLDKFAGKAEPIWLLGEGLVYYKDKFNTEGIKFLDEACWYPKAAKVHLLGWKKAAAGQFADPLTLTPTYLRSPDVKPKR